MRGLLPTQPTRGSCQLVEGIQRGHRVAQRYLLSAPKSRTLRTATVHSQGDRHRSLYGVLLQGSAPACAHITHRLAQYRALCSVPNRRSQAGSWQGGWCQLPGLGQRLAPATKVATIPRTLRTTGWLPAGCKRAQGVSNLAGRYIPEIFVRRRLGADEVHDQGAFCRSNSLGGSAPLSEQAPPGRRDAPRRHPSPCCAGREPHEDPLRANRPGPCR
mgnify:FL=1